MPKPVAPFPADARVTARVLHLELQIERIRTKLDKLLIEQNRLVRNAMLEHPDLTAEDLDDYTFELPDENGVSWILRKQPVAGEPTALVDEGSSVEED